MFIYCGYYFASCNSKCHHLTISTFKLVFSEPSQEVYHSWVGRSRIWGLKNQLHEENIRFLHFQFDPVTKETVMRWEQVNSLWDGCALSLFILNRKQLSDKPVCVCPGQLQEQQRERGSEIKFGSVFFCKFWQGMKIPLRLQI